MSISEIQKQFMDSIFNRNSQIHENIKESTIPVDGRMRIYRNSTIGILIQTLKDSYPVLHELVGDDFFEAMANHFIQKHKPNTGDITDYGWELPNFLKTFKPVEDYLYFQYIAELELHRQQSYYANNLPVLTAEELQSNPAKLLENLRITLQPCVFIGCFDYAINSIWLSHQTDDVENNMSDIDISKPENSMTYRYGMDIFTKQITKEEFTFLNTLQNTKSLQKAIDAQVKFDTQNMLEFLLKYELLTKENK